MSTNSPSGLVRKFTVSQVLLTFQRGGKVAATFDIDSVTAEPYFSDLDEFRLVLEIIFVIFLVYNVGVQLQFLLYLVLVNPSPPQVLGEVRGFFHSYREKGYFWAHFADFWNVLDFISLGIQTAVMVFWCSFEEQFCFFPSPYSTPADFPHRLRYVFVLAEPFKIELRYDVYDLASVKAPGQYWNIRFPGNEFGNALKAVETAHKLSQFRSLYTAFNGIR